MQRDRAGRLFAKLALAEGDTRALELLAALVAHAFEARL